MILILNNRRRFPMRSRKSRILIKSSGYFYGFRSAKVFCCRNFFSTWWHHQMSAFLALLALYAGNIPVHGEVPSQRQVVRSFDAFFDLCLNIQLSTQVIRRWFETPSRSLWRHWHDNHRLLNDIGRSWMFSWIVLSAKNDIACHWVCAYWAI